MQENERKTNVVKKAWKDGGKVNGYRKIYDDMGEAVSENRMVRLARLAGIKAQIGYQKKPGVCGGKPSVVVDNTLDRQVTVDASDRAGVTDITYLRTHEGFVYLCVVIDPYFRRVDGWAILSRQTSELAVQESLVAIWPRKPGPAC